MEKEKHTPSPTLIEHYRQQMMALYGARTNTPPQEENNWLDQRYPEPNIERDRMAMAEVAQAPSAAEISSPPPTNDYIGYLRVFVFTGEGAEPLVGARVVVSRQGQVYANLTTDRDGYTPVIPLPSVDPALSQRPGNTAPYVTYDIAVQANGFRPARYDSVPLYGNNYVTQPAALLPLLPGENPEVAQQFSSGGPTNL